MSDATRLAQQNEALRLLAAESAPMMVAEWARRVHESDNPDDVRKYVEWCSRVTGAEVKKEDTGPKLPTLTINFNLGGIQAQVATPDVVDAVEVAQAVTQATPVAGLENALLPGSDPAPEPAAESQALSEFSSLLDLVNESLDA